MYIFDLTHTIFKSDVVFFLERLRPDGAGRLPAVNRCGCSCLPPNESRLEAGELRRVSLEEQRQGSDL